jgi:undecaprenyl-diphosphatase
VSSSGHLVVFQHLLGLTEPQLLFDVMLHLGTLAAVFVVFRTDLIRMARGVLRALAGTRTPVDNVALRLLMLVIAASVPTGLIGLLFRDFFESLFASVFYVGIGFLITGTLLWSSRYAPGTAKNVQQTSLWDALMIGFFQGLAITPGISRSGTTISAALMAGLERGLAARFSFLLSIPAILGAALLETLEATAVEPGAWPAMLAGTLASGIVGYVALKILIRMVIAGNFSLFAYYCWAAGLFTLWVIWYG